MTSFLDLFHSPSMRSSLILHLRIAHTKPQQTNRFDSCTDTGKVRSLKLCPLAILMPLEENPYIVPHLKALISGKNFWVGQRCGSTLSL